MFHDISHYIGLTWLTASPHSSRFWWPAPAGGCNHWGTPDPANPPSGAGACPMAAGCIIPPAHPPSNPAWQPARLLSGGACSGCPIIGWDIPQAPHPPRPSCCCGCPIKGWDIPQAAHPPRPSCCCGCPIKGWDIPQALHPPRPSCCCGCPIIPWDMP